MSGEQERHVWVILHERGLGHSWTDYAYWGVAETYEAAEEKLTRAVQQGKSFTASRTSPHDVMIYMGRTIWRIKRVTL